MTSFHHVTIMPSSCYHHAIIMPPSIRHNPSIHASLINPSIPIDEWRMDWWILANGWWHDDGMVIAWWWHDYGMIMAWLWHDGNMMKWCHHFLTVYVATCMLTNTIKLVSSHSFLLIPLPTFWLVCLYTSLSNVRSWILRTCSRTTPPLRSSEGWGGFSAISFFIRKIMKNQWYVSKIFALRALIC